MSRSFKKHPFCKEFNRRKYPAKKFANTKVRSYIKSGKDISNGNCYRKIYNRWDIFEYYSYKTLQEEISDWETGKWSWQDDMTYNQVKYSWYQMYKRK